MRLNSILFGLALGVSTLLSAEVTKATAQIKPLSGSKVTGLVTFTKTEKGVFVVADIDGLTPGKHGFHVHEKGDCGSHDGMTAGGHFNPTNAKHGAPWDKDRHVGDLGNVVADEKGHAHYEWHDQLIALEGTNSVLGRSILVHEKADDYTTQPTGDSGGRVGCGLIQESR